MAIIELLIQIGDNVNLLVKEKNDALYKDGDTVEARFDSDPRTWSPGESRRLLKLLDAEVAKLCFTYSCTETELLQKFMESEYEDVIVDGEAVKVMRQRRKMRCNVKPSKDLVIEIADTAILLKPSNIER